MSFQLRWKNYFLSIYRYVYGSTILLFFCFLSSNNHYYLFSIAQFLNKIVKPKYKTSFGKLLRPTLYCKIFAELNLIEFSLTKMRHLRDSNRFQFIHKVLLKRFKRFLSKARQQERLSDNSSFTNFTLNYKIRISKVILNLY